jgi:hypothetical protein
MIDHRFDDRGDIGDATAASGDGDRLTGPDFVAQIEPRKLPLDLARHIMDAGPLECLANPEELGIVASRHFVCVITSLEPRIWRDDSSHKKHEKKRKRSGTQSVFVTFCASCGASAATTPAG